MHEPFQEAEILKASLAAAGIGTWYIDTDGTMHVDELGCSLLAIPQSGLNYNQAFEFINPNDKRIIIKAISDGKIAVSFKTYAAAEPRWLKLKGSIHAETGNFYGTAEDVTQEKEEIQKTTDSEYRHRNIIEEAPIAAALYVGKDLIVEIANDVMLSYWGRDRSVIGTKLEEAVPELKGQPFVQILTDIFDSGEIYQVTEAPVDVALEGKLGTYYFDFTYKPVYNTNGKIYAIMNVAVNVTDRVLSKRKLQLSESRFRAITEQSPMAIGLLKGREMEIEIGNEKIFEVWGKGSSIVGMKLIEALPEIEGQPFMEMLENVYDSGKPFYGYDVLAKLVKGGVLTDVYFDFIYSPLKDEAGKTTGVLILANDVTVRVETLRKIAESEAKFRSLIDSAPAAIGLFTGRELIVEMPNQAFIEIVGRGPDIEGKPLRQLMPELESQPFLKIIDDVFTSGKMYRSYGTQVMIVKHGVETLNFYDIIFTPLFDADGEIYAVLDISIDVTESIKVQQAVVEAEASLRGAIELAELGTWYMDPNTGVTSFSERLLQWYGLENEVENAQYLYDTIHPDDQTRIQEAITRALMPGSDGIYDEEYTIINRQTGRERVLHAQGKTFFDKDGLPYLLSGTAQDITSHRKLQLALENDVKERTEELRAANDELGEANRQLTASNEELAQYAYVASHDLQEPLRKITIFSNLLQERDEEAKNKPLIDKIIKASRRMSLLIKDLLEFSRLLNTDARYVETDLNTIVSAVKDDFELLVQQKQAIINIGKLPLLNAVPLQMNQLFYNLINNALKFVPEDRKPIINITCEIADCDTLKQHLHIVDGSTQYYKITVQDNGIGIQDEYKKQIFEVFKRLHTRDEYSGSGIGLAICRRIATNHSGAIFISSEIGKGTSFYIILPQKQVMSQIVEPNI